MPDRHIFLIGMQGCGKSSLGKRVARETGSTVMNPENRHIMRSWGRIIWLDRPLEDILSDIKLDRRPDLRDGGLAEVERTYREQAPVYRDLADITIRNDKGYHMAVYTLSRVVQERF